MTLRNLCVSSETAQRLGEKAIRFADVFEIWPSRVDPAGRGLLVPIAIWHPRLVGLHGGVAPSPSMPGPETAAKAAAIRILGQVADKMIARRLWTTGAAIYWPQLPLRHWWSRRSRTTQHGSPRADGALWTLARIATRRTRRLFGDTIERKRSCDLEPNKIRRHRAASCC